MTSRRKGNLRVTALLLAAWPTAAAPDATLVLRNVNAVPMTGERVIEDVSIVMTKGTITAIGNGAALRAPAGAREVDGRGSFVVPGLIEMHVHLRDAASLDLFLANGVTAVRNMDGTEQVLAWRDAIAAGERRGPKVVSGSPFLHRHAKDAPERYVGSVEDALRLTREYHRRGYDAIKIAELDDAPFFALMREARRLAIPVVGHIPNYDLALDRVLSEGMASIEHLEELFRVYFDYRADASKIPGFVELVRRSGVPISTLITSERIKNGLQLEGEAYLTPSRRAWIERFNGPAGVERVRGAIRSLASGDWARHPVDVDFLTLLVRELHDAGVVVVPGTDSGGSLMIAGFGLHDELALFLEAGLSPYEALRAATVDAAAVLGLGARKGTIEVGKDADLVLVKKNPLTSLDALREPEGLALRGTWLDAAELASLRQRGFDRRP